MKKLASMLTMTAFAISVGNSAAFAVSNGGGNSANAAGQQNAIENCFRNIIKQNTNGQTGSNTGSSNDKKQLPTAVTNCDHFWNDNPTLPRPISSP